MLTTDHGLDERLADSYGITGDDERTVVAALLDHHDYRANFEGFTAEQIAGWTALDPEPLAPLLDSLVDAGLCLRVSTKGAAAQYRLNHAVAHRLSGTTAHEAAVSTASGYSVDLDRKMLGRQEAYKLAKETDAYRLLASLFGQWRFMERLTGTALRRLADGQMLDPNSDIWETTDAAATGVLRRHGITSLQANKLSLSAVRELRDGQRAADEKAGLTWQTAVAPEAIAAEVREAHRTLPIDLDDPQAWDAVTDKRAALARRLGVEDWRADDLSRWSLANPDGFDAGEPRCWRIASASWLELVDEQLGPMRGDVARPVGVIVMPSEKDPGAWVLRPALSLELIRLVADLGGEIDRSLQAFAVPRDRLAELLARMNTNVLVAWNFTGGVGEKIADNLKAVNEALGTSLASIAPDDKRDAWGRLQLRSSAPLMREFSIHTTGGRAMNRRRLGFCRWGEGKLTTTASAPMDLGEAVETAIERGLPLLLSTEAAGHLAGQIRVGRMKGRPGQLTITSSDGLAAHTRRVPADQAIVELRKLRESDTPVILDAGARQIVQMLLAKPLGDDPILLGRQTEIAALKVVGSGLDASQVGTGKSVTSGRAIYHRAARTPRWRGFVTADGRLLDQWRSELHDGAPSRGMPPLAPNVDILIVDERTSPAAQLRAWDRRLGDQPGLALIPDSILDRYPADVCAITWHLWLADEALRYVNPATEAHRAARYVRFQAVADCWLLTATPKGKSAGHLDVLVGLAVGDAAMIDERLNTREAGDLVLEENAHRVRLNYGPTLVRITRPDMKAWMPDVRPAEPLAITADAALQELLEAIREGGREDYRRLLAALKRMKAIEEQQGKKTDVYKKAMAEVSRWQAFVLANVNVFVDASVDPETLLHSNAALAQSLVHTSKVEAAVRGGGDGLPTLRGIVAQTLARAAVDEQLLVFAERTRPLHQLSRTLKERWGMEAPVGDGKLKPAEFEDVKSRFIAGEFPILLLSPVGNSGHNLQNASGIMHLDLPWVQTGLEQRVGRSGRLGNTRGYVQTWIPYIRGGGIEHVVATLADRGAEHHQLLDAFEGVEAAESTIATQLGAITSQVAASKDEAGHAKTAARLRVAAAVFGA